MVAATELSNPRKLRAGRLTTLQAFLVRPHDIAFGSIRREGLIPENTAATAITDQSDTDSYPRTYPNPHIACRIDLARPELGIEV